MSLQNYLIVDSHLLFSSGLKSLLTSIQPAAQINLATSLADADLRIRERTYDLIFLEVLLAGASEDDIKRFINNCERTYPNIKIIIVSGLSQIFHIRRYFATTNIKGWLSKNVSFNEVKEAVTKIVLGEVYISKDINRKLANSMLFSSRTQLTGKEIEVLDLVVQGYNVKQMAERLYISPYTVLAHRRNIMKKLDVHSAQELVRYAYDNQLA